MTARLSLTAGAALAFLLQGSGAIAQAYPVAAPVITGTRLDLTVEGVVHRVPDLATINAGVVTEAPNAAAAMQENARRIATTIAALKKAGIADRDIQTAAISLNPQYRYVDGQAPVITGYQASNQLAIRFREIRLAGAILDTLVAQGVNQINGPNLSVANSEAALDEARGEAAKIARHRAELYAQATGLHVKRILAISESGGNAPTPYPVMAMARDKSASTAIEPGEQSLTINLSISFELE